MNIQIRENSDLSFRLAELHASARDASFYRILPRIIMRPFDERDIISIFAEARSTSRSITFRAAGTSLSGQALGNDIIADISRNWKKLEVIGQGDRVTVQPGMVCGLVNRELAKYGRKLGFDPASIDTCMIGGALANNSSGMRSGVRLNPYNTMHSIRFILPSGTIIDTSDKNADEILQRKELHIYKELEAIRDEILSDESIRLKIEDSYKIKNTIGYAINAFIDFRKPADILAHLMIGSEGTLGFICEAAIDTFPLHPHKLTSMLFFDDMDKLCSALFRIKNLGATAIEIMDEISLDAGRLHPNLPAELRSLPPGINAILCEFEAADHDAIESINREFLRIIPEFGITHPPYIARDEHQRAALWDMRKGLLAALGRHRPPRSSFIIEDICVPLKNLTEAFAGLRRMFEYYGYDNAGVYGHGTDGNLHFMIAPDFSDNVQIHRFGRFMDEMADMVISLGGALKAEHGTGRNMAPYVARQWGSDIFKLMKRVKHAIDPMNILNPGVIINDDEHIHLKNLKEFPDVDPEADLCIECGFCEPICPSRNLTATPRRRISVMREINSINNHLPELSSQILDEYIYYGRETCAADGLCETRCPLGVNAGSMIKKLRNTAESKRAQQVATWIAANFANASAIAAGGVRIAKTAESMLSPKILTSLTRFADNHATATLPKWNAAIGHPEEVPVRLPADAAAICFPCCMNRIMGRSGEPGPIRAMIDVSRELGGELMIPRDIRGHCCGMAFDSKGHFAAAGDMVNKTIAAMWEWSREGELPIVFDSSSCAYFIKNCRKYIDSENRIKYDSLRFLDSIEYIYGLIDRKRDYPKVRGRIALHPTCAVRKMNLTEKFSELASFFAENVYIPENLQCCGFAGDRGFLYPELNLSAASIEAAEIAEYKPERCYSSNLPCEIGMQSASGYEFRSFIFMIYEALDL